SERGQVFAIASIAMVAICGIAGFSIDVGSWYQAQRKQQAIADAPPLAAAWDLPASPSQATTDAIAYAAKSGGTLSVGNVTYSTTYAPNDTVTVKTTATAPSMFLKVLGIGSAGVGAIATAEA